MKKVYGIVLSVIGIVIALVGILLKVKESTAVSIIGGVDGPTSIYVAGKIGSVPVIISVILGIVLLVIGIWVIVKNYKKK